MTFFLWFMGALACYRITVLFVRDAGPKDIFKRLRKISHFSKLLSCPFCTSIWVGAVIETGYYFSGVRDLPVVCVCIALSFSAVSIMLDRTFSADYQT